MTLAEAASSLHREIFDAGVSSWCQGIGRAEKPDGTGKIVVYLKKRQHPCKFDIWEGWPVEYEYIGKVIIGPVDRP